MNTHPGHTHPGHNPPRPPGHTHSPWTCTPPIVDRMTDTCENITFAALVRNAVGN